MVVIHRAYKVELKPNKFQVAAFVKHCGVARFAYNWALETKNNHYEETGEMLSWNLVNKAFNAKKKTDFPWVYEVSKWAHQNAIMDLENAFHRFFVSRNSSHPVSCPTFKSKHIDKLQYKVSLGIKVEHARIRLPKIGWVRLKQKGYIPTEGVKINSATISEKAGKWFVSVQVEEDIEVSENQTDSVIGLDLGIKSFVVGSDGSEVESPKFLKKSQRKIAKLSRKKDKKQKGSNNRKKAVKKLAKAHYKVACQRNDFLHKTSHHYVENFGTIVVEDLAVQNMLQNHYLAEAISDSGWSEFRRQLEYKSVWSGKTCIRADRFYPSTKRCSNCGHIKDEMPLSVRTYCCEKCGFTCDRDLNAARNLEEYGRARYAQTGWSQDHLTPVETKVA